MICHLNDIESQGMLQECLSDFTVGLYNNKKPGAFPETPEYRV